MSKERNEDGTFAVEGKESETRYAENSKLVSSVSKGLSAIFGEEGPTEETVDETDDSSTATEGTEEVTEETTETTETEETEVKEDEAATEEGETETEEEAEEAAPAKKAGPTLPDAHRRSLKAYGWEDDEIDANLTALGDKFIGLAQKIHSNRNTEVAQWANAGRAAKQQTTDGQQTTTTAATTPTGLKPIDVKALKEHFGEDKMVDQIAAPINAVIEQINRILPQVQEVQQNATMSQLEVLGRQVDEFFGGKELKSYTEVYGDAKTQLSEKSVQARNKVLELADALMTGAQLQGRKLSLGEALTYAHDSLSGDYKVKAARSEIKGSLKKREKGITLKPGNKSKTIAATKGNKPATRSDLEKKVAQGLAKVFGKR